MNNYYFDQNGVYTHSLPAMPGTTPPINALRVSPRMDTNKQPWPGEWPVVNGSRDGWSYTEDNRLRLDAQGHKIDGTGTPYWMPGDTWRSPARYMTGIGPLPEGVLLSAPAKTEEESRQERIEEIKFTLLELDAKSGRSARALLLDIMHGVEPLPADSAALASIEAEVIDLRAELAVLMQPQE